MKKLKEAFAKLRHAVAPPQEFTPFPGPDRRTAVLVVHGIGAQKPYATLDQFARGLIRRFGGTKNVRQEVKFRHWDANPINRQQDWTQTFLRLTPANAQNADRVVDVFEYYWAPVITDLVTSRQSLRFLLLSALSPFQYLRENLAALGAVKPSGKPALPFTFWEKLKSSWYLLARELFRMLFIFVPFILIVVALFLLISHTASKVVTIPMETYFRSGKLDAHQIFDLGLTCIRWLLLAMSALFLFEEFFKGSRHVAQARSGPLYRTVMGALFLVLLAGPLIDDWWARHVPYRIPAWLYWTAVIVAVLALPYSKTLRDSGVRAIRAILRHPLVSGAGAAVALGVAYAYRFPPSWLPAKLLWLRNNILHLPDSVHWQVVALTALLGILAYLVNMFLKSAIGGLAVYLGSDDLSKNYAARSQILHECTETLLHLLDAQRDLAKAGNAEEQRYDRVLIAAHSLGSVIAFDSLNQLIVRQQACDPKLVGRDLNKIEGLLTFGCPLNKVVYFFRTRTSLSTTVLERILFTLHPFRYNLPLSADASTAVKPPYPYPLQPFTKQRCFKWINAYSPFDLISGKMFFYSADDDVLVEKGVMPWTAHLSYWENDTLYEEFVNL